LLYKLFEPEFNEKPLSIENDNFNVSPTAQLFIGPNEYKIKISEFPVIC